MTDYVVWLDSEKAQLYNLTQTGVRKSHLAKKNIDHHSHDKKDHSHDSNLEHFFKDLATQLRDAEHVLLVGPGMAKLHFKNHLETHHADGLVKKIIGIENSDHPTDNQILAEARKFYQHYNLFNSTIESV
jgi:stalled ribosome rescue protein Dom34